MFREKYAQVFDGDERWRSLPIPTGERFEWSDDSTYIRNPPFFEHLTHDPVPPADITRRARARRARRQRHDGSHLAGGLDSGRQPGGEVPDRQGRAAGRLQLVRRAARQPRGDDARHVREHPAAQPARARDRGRLDDRCLPDGRGDDDLRRLDEVPGRGRAAASSSPARSTAPARRATGRRRARCCSASRRCSPRASSASTAATWSTWACCRCASAPARMRRRSS